MTKEPKRAWVVDEELDNVATILTTDVVKGMEISFTVKGDVKKLVVEKDIPFGHKVAIVPIKKGDIIMKYGLSIGAALEDIAVGQHVHVHNIESLRGRGDLHAAKEGAC